MKTLVISYSHSGNNKKLASGIADALGATHLALNEKGKRTVMKTVLDVILNRTPGYTFQMDQVEHYTKLIFVAPVWLGTVASPFRGLFRDLAGLQKDYAFVSLSAGADGENPGLEKELTRRLGKAPDVVINPLIRDLLPPELNPSRKDLDAYKLNDEDARLIIPAVLKELDACFQRKAG